MSKLYISDNGQGQPTIILLHYFGGSSRTWKPVVDLLANQFRCVSVDLPGFGSSADCRMDNYAVSSSANALGKTIADLNIEKFVLVGHSMGGKIALQFASSKPVGLHAVILVAGSPPVPEPMTDEDRQALREKYGKADEIREHLKKIAHQELPSGVLDELVEDNLKANAEAWYVWVETGSREDISDLMENIELPVHLIAGEFDDPLTPEYTLEISEKYFGGAEVHTIANTGHLLPIEAPDELAALIEWLL